MTRIIDLNADLGEGVGTDAELMPLISSANVASCAHAGDPVIARATLELAAKHSVQVGVHPGFPDREHFGRREMNLPMNEVMAHLLYQIGGLTALLKLTPVTRLGYLKPHGALYNLAMREREYARVIAAAAMMTGLAVVGLPRSELQRACEAVNVHYVNEGFADRRYRSDGTLVPRQEKNAFVTDVDEALDQIEALIENHQVQTICVHGDHPEAIEFTSSLRRGLLERGYQIQAFL